MGDGSTSDHIMNTPQTFEEWIDTEIERLSKGNFADYQPMVKMLETVKIAYLGYERLLEHTSAESREDFTQEDIGRRWNLADVEHRRSWLVAAVGASANMQLTFKPFNELSIHLQSDLYKVYLRGTDMSFYKRVYQFKSYDVS